MQSSSVLGGFCGIIIAIVTNSDTFKRTVIARFMGLFSAVLVQGLLSTFGIPYRIIMHIYRDENWLEELGHLTINELIGYGFGLMYFWYSLLASFFVSVVVFLLSLE